jgi:hypothetical protein
MKFIKKGKYGFTEIESWFAIKLMMCAGKKEIIEHPAKSYKIDWSLMETCNTAQLTKDFISEVRLK